MHDLIALQNPYFYNRLNKKDWRVMYILKNALVSITRSKGRNILICAIIVVIAAACAIALSIMNSADKIVKAYEDKYQIKATIGMNRDYMMSQFKGNNRSQEEMINDFNGISGLTEDEVNKYGDSDYVSSYYYTYSVGMNANDIKEATDSLQKDVTETTTEKKYTTTTPNSGSSDSQSGSSSGGSGAGGSSGGGAAPGGSGGPGGRSGSASGGSGSSGSSGSTTTEETTRETHRSEQIKNMKAETGTYTLVGYDSYASMSDFVSGTYTITDGQVSNDFESNSCVISKELADMNSLSVGSTITFVDPKDTNHTYQLTVTGIYSENSEDASNTKNMFSESANTIITNQTVVKNIVAGNSNQTATIEPTYILKNADAAEPFANEVQEKGLSSYYQVENNLSEVQSATKGVSNIGTFAFTFLLITVIIGGVVLFVINMINIRERKYEIGVLRTIGMSKLRVIWQFVLELLIVSLVGLIIGAVIGSACSVNIANKLLENEIQNTQSQVESISNNFGANMSDMPGGGMTPPDGGGQGGQGGQGGPGGSDKFNGVVSVSKVDSINAVVDFTVLAELLGLGLLLTLISSLAACIAIARFSPLEILRERS